MTPERRLDQLEPLMADSLQKIDRLIEGQGKILDVATRAEQKVDTTAKAVADLTITTQRQYRELKAGQEELRADVQGLKAGQEELRADVQGLKAGQEELRADVQGLQADVHGLQTDVRGLQTDMRGLQTDVQGLQADVQGLKAGQEAIMQYLREKLP